jgi:hypothetical protein
MTEPLTPGGLDLRDFQYMPLDVVRLVDSDLAAISTGDEFKAAVILWCKSWHQIPAASLPDDDRMLAHLAGFGRDVKSWLKVKDMALRGFEKCSDGRLYHRHVAAKAVEAGDAKQRQRERTNNATLARKQRSGQRDGPRYDERDEQRNVERDEQRNDDRNVHQGRGKGIERGKGIKEGKEGVDARARDPHAEKLTFDAVVKSWNLMADETKLPAVQTLTDQRKTALRLRLFDIGGLNGWYALVDKIRGSPMLLGHNDRGWKTSFDWVLQPKNLTKIMEGNYDASTPKPDGNSAFEIIADTLGGGHAGGFGDVRDAQSGE